MFCDTSTTAQLSSTRFVFANINNSKTQQLSSKQPLVGNKNMVNAAARKRKRLVQEERARKKYNDNEGTQYVMIRDGEVGRTIDDKNIAIS